jgi:hypothetical protein
MIDVAPWETFIAFGQGPKARRGEYVILLCPNVPPLEHDVGLLRECFSI